MSKENIHSPKNDPNKGKRAKVHSAKLSDFSYANVVDALPDPDMILAKRGLNVSAYQSLLNDDHLYSVWETRVSAVSGCAWELVCLDESAKNTKAYECILDIFNKLDVVNLIESVLNSLAFGYQPFEIHWVYENGLWSVDGLSAKPSEWFAYDGEGRLKLRKGYELEEVEENRFIVARYKASYTNPYGEKLFSRCFWPVKLKQKGIDWFSEFVEKFGSLFLVGKYASNASVRYQEDLLNALDSIVGSGVSVVNEDTQIEVLESSAKKASADVHVSYIEMMERAISKAVLGQTLTTDTGKSGAGSYALGQVHNEIRLDRSIKDKRLVESFFNEFIALVCGFNFSDASFPVFRFKEVKKLDLNKAKLYEGLHKMGVQVNLEQISDEFDIPLAMLSRKSEAALSVKEMQAYAQAARENTKLSDFGKVFNEGLQAIYQRMNEACSFDEALDTLEFDANPLGRALLEENFKNTVLSEVETDEE